MLQRLKTAQIWRMCKRPDKRRAVRKSFPWSVTMSCSTTPCLLELETDEANSFLDSFDAVIFDCDGVLWSNGRPLPGVRRVLERLKDLGKKLHFLSNNTTKTYQTYEEHFLQIGVHLKCEDLLHPAIAVAEYLRQINFCKKIFCIGSSFLVDALGAQGFHCISASNSCPEDVNWISRRLEDDPSVGAVLMDMDVNCNYLKLSRAVALLRRADVLYLVGAQDEVLPVSGGTFLGPGPFQRLVSSLSGRRPLVLGKPGMLLIQQVMERFRISDPKRTLFIGDMIKQDMEFASCCGFQKVLVLSGGSKLTDLTDSVEPQQKPDYWLHSLGHLDQVLDRVTESKN